MLRFNIAGTSACVCVPVWGAACHPSAPIQCQEGRGITWFHSQSSRASALVSEAALFLYGALLEELNSWHLFIVAVHTSSYLSVTPPHYQDNWCKEANFIAHLFILWNDARCLASRLHSLNGMNQAVLNTNVGKWTCATTAECDPKMCCYDLCVLARGNCVACRV